MSGALVGIFVEEKAPWCLELRETLGESLSIFVKKLDYLNLKDFLKY